MPDPTDLLDTLPPPPAATAGRLDRRRFLCGGMAALAAALLPTPALAALRTATATLPPERTLTLYNSHTGESLRATYWRHGAYLRDALAEIDYLLRDHRTGDVQTIEPTLLDLLSTLHARLESRDPIHVISGYRSPATNAALRNHGHGVARHSLHMAGMAVDFDLPDRDLPAIRRAAIALRGGGVGYYPESQFVHVDVGPVRHW
jgi:uncharacterized protein YcbK (DUF882 family)